MKSNIIKIVLILCIIFTFCMGVVLATEEDDVSDSTNTSNTTEETNTSETSPEDALAQSSVAITQVSPLSNLPEANLGLNNILNILLITVGILLILFAIAILIRLKK